MLNTLLELLKPALLRLALYLGILAFGLLGAAVTKLGLGSYDEAAQTITISRDAFVTAISVMIAGGLTAIVAYFKGWTGTKTPAPPSP